ncbi:MULTISPECIES: hypothetical protein [unclassified Massilia]|uniref:hypothetical protein n=1 Tax=unclassified Massilia TaxID=2609279 RepID=UPI001B844676|nr:MULTISPECIES: hypothetical protein [unclassified Massilia]MBQ5942866.1 hypothetical protein [Massilia sp. AB1]MBQ5962800.1 hypothetical protein [Massilia sp. ZL223]
MIDTPASAATCSSVVRPVPLAFPPLLLLIFFLFLVLIVIWFRRIQRAACFPEHRIAPRFGLACQYLVGEMPFSDARAARNACCA